MRFMTRSLGPLTVAILLVASLPVHAQQPHDDQRDDEHARGAGGPAPGRRSSDGSRQDRPCHASRTARGPAFEWPIEPPSAARIVASYVRGTL